MKSISGRPPSDPRQLSREAGRSREDASTQAAGSKRAPQESLQVQQAEQSKQPRTSQGRARANRINPIQQQWLSQQNAKAHATSAPGGSQRTRTQDPLQPVTLDLEHGLSPEQEQDLLAWARAQPEDPLMPLSPEHEPRWTPEQARDLLAWAPAERVDQAPAAGAARPGPRQAPADLSAPSLAPEVARPVAQASALNNVTDYQEALRTHGFSPAQISNISQQPLSLEFLAKNYPKLQQALPELTRLHVTNFAMTAVGSGLLASLLFVAADLKAPPLNLNDGQLIEMAARGGSLGLRAAHKLRHKLSREPYGLDGEQISRIARYNYGHFTLEQLERLLPILMAEPYNISHTNVVNMASRHSARATLQAVEEHMPTLIGEGNEMTRPEVIRAAITGGSQALRALVRYLPVLVNPPYNQTKEKVLGVVFPSSKNWVQRLEAFKSDLDAKLASRARPT